MDDANASKTTTKATRECVKRSGTFFRGFYFPSTLGGRSECFSRDLRILIGSFTQEYAARRTEDAKLAGWTFLAFKKKFADLNFSEINATAANEDASLLFDLRVGLCIDIMREDLGSLLQRAACVYCLYVLYYTQTPVNKNVLGVVPTALCPLRLSLESMENLKALVEDVTAAESMDFAEVPLMIERLLDDNAVTISSWDGPALYYQGRNGEPLRGPLEETPHNSSSRTSFEPLAFDVSDLNPAVNEAEQLAELSVFYSSLRDTELNNKGNMGGADDVTGSLQSISNSLRSASSSRQSHNIAVPPYDGVVSPTNKKAIDFALSDSPTGIFKKTRAAKGEKTRKMIKRTDNDELRQHLEGFFD